MVLSRGIAHQWAKSNLVSNLTRANIRLPRDARTSCRRNLTMRLSVKLLGGRASTQYSVCGHVFTALSDGDGPQPVAPTAHLKTYCLAGLIPGKSRGTVRKWKLGGLVYRPFGPAAKTNEHLESLPRSSNEKRNIVSVSRNCNLEACIVL